MTMTKSKKWLITIACNMRQLLNVLTRKKPFPLTWEEPELSIIIDLVKENEIRIRFHRKKDKNPTPDLLEQALDSLEDEEGRCNG